ncbi:RNA-directed DNA polymerase (Reverse transcriptase) [Trifolium medium]|uniref:RNA-directed DNA polymerase (Reverse transcriptase) n=1 Tax=Trifolium medium TaxID=97028 RepID=A0A392RL35_9FABA|nr:RNA-directed DNA polymerase (Reverse transcriptase) [Trifolium medium]
MLPSHDEIRAVVFALNKDSAPGPDGFGAFFYQHYWDIVKKDVINAMLEFFTTSWILRGFNSNIISLLPKTPDASSFGVVTLTKESLLLPLGRKFADPMLKGV